MPTDNIKVLIISTGGTISMVKDNDTGALRPADFSEFRSFLPELEHTNLTVEMYPVTPSIDSSNVNPGLWKNLAQTIYEQYDEYDGFVVLHGTDTMAYSASALSFMLENLQKPIVFTGSQLPIGVFRSDARENLQTAIEIAAAQDEDGNPIVPEVTIFFEDRLFRGNRTTKKNAEHFDAFCSYNYPPLAKAGVHIHYFPHLVFYSDTKQPLKLHTLIDSNVAILKIFPGISHRMVKAILNIRGLRAVVLETYGTGNAPTDKWLFEDIKAAVERGVIIVNKTQCVAGSVEMGRYETSLNLLQAGVLSGHDITTEALVTKLMFLLGGAEDTEMVKLLLSQSICGEMTID